MSTVAVVRNRIRRGQDAVIFATADQIELAREWALECSNCIPDPSADADAIAETIRAARASVIVRHVDNVHEGGWDGFLALHELD